MKRAAFALAVWTVCIAAGCAGTKSFDFPPPVAPIHVPLPSGGFARGGGVWIGSKVLTALHTFVQGDAVFPPPRIILDRWSIPVLGGESGDPEVVRHLYGRPIDQNMPDQLNDWACIEVPLTAPPSTPVEVGDGRVVEGETLYLVGFERDKEQEGPAALPLRVVHVESDDPIPERLICVYERSGAKMSGWSGSFVGRFREDLLRWEFVGIFINEATVTDGRRDWTVYTVMRPPERVLHEVMGGAAAPAAVAGPRVP